jgi:hypothetical protein
MSFTVPNKYRVRSGPYGTDDNATDFGAFFVPNKFARTGAPLKVIACSDSGWEHVSVSLPNRCPTWDEMCFIKDLFWSDDEVVMQLHPRRADYVNNHPYCLHLWRPFNAALPLPPTEAVGIPGLER